MKLTTLAASLISAGLATLITAKVVEKHMLNEFDERLDEELKKSVDFLIETKFDLKKPSVEEVFKEKVKDETVPDSPQPSPLDMPASNNQRTRYDTILRGETYSSEAQPEGEVNVTDQLPDIVTISTEEFMENESGFMQCTLTYFSDGGVLDEEYDLVPAHQDWIGTEVPPFGELSGEPHVVYLRNNRLRREFEVIQDEAKAADVLDPAETP